MNRATNPRNTAPPNLHADQIMKDTLLTVLTTSKGWIIRQALKLTAGGLATFAAAIQAKAVALNIPLDKVEAALTPFQAFASAAVVLLIEVGLSFIARKNP